MYVYLPIAEIAVNVWVFLGMGAAVGFLSGMFGVGGGFLMTPLLVFAGVPPSVAVGTQTAQIVASSVSGAIAQYRRRNVDLKLGGVLVLGGVAGSVAGVEAVKLLTRAGQFELFLTLSYVVFLGVIGGLMFVESLTTIRKSRLGRPATARRPGRHSWLHGLPFKMRFHASKLYISALPPFALGVLAGLLVAIMGVGGGFIVVPFMIYVLRVPTNVAVGTSLFQIVFVTATTAIFHAAQNKNVDVVLALPLMLGGVFGAQWGAAAGQRLRGEHLRLLLAALVLLVGLRAGVDLFAKPDDIYSLSRPGGSA